MPPQSQVWYPQLRDKDWLHQRYVVDAAGPTAIAREVGCTTRTVMTALGYAGIPVRGGGGIARQWEPTVEDLAAEYAAAGSAQALARQRELSLATIYNVFARAGLHPSDVPVTPYVFRRYPPLADRAWLQEAARTMMRRQIADTVGCSPGHVVTAAKLHGLDPPSVGAPPAVRAEAVRMYVDQGFRLAEVAAVVGYDQSRVWRWLQAAGVDTSRGTRMGPATAVTHGVRAGGPGRAGGSPRE